MSADNGETLLRRPSPADTLAARAPVPADTAARDVPPDPTAARMVGDTLSAHLTPEAELRQPRPANFVEGYTVRGRYLLEKLIGQGAMGQVWQARDLLAEEAHERNPRIALKVLKADFEARPDAFVAMHREATRAQKLAHPNVVTVYVFDRDDASGRVFIAMELLDGQPLDELIRSAGPDGLARERALPIIRGMAEGLAYAHRRGIVHSDFKPANVFLTRDGTPKILDFGIARAVQMAGGSEESDDSGFQGYTPSYAAPEALEGGAPSTAEDVFSLGVVAFELVTGRHPFNRLSATEARDAHFERPPLHGLKHRESRAIDRALAVERTQRFADAGAFLRALQGVPFIQKALAAAVCISVLAAGGFWYRSYLASLPDVPFSQLPLAQQQEFLRNIEDGNKSLEYVERTHDPSASQDAAHSFDEAYRLHPRDPQAVRGLNAAANYAIDWYGKMTDKQEALAQLKLFREKSKYYETYAPMQRAVQAAGGE
jgi:serine/threonine protein kinase